MKNLYDFITTLCKNRNMKLEDLQKKLVISRSTLYRYMKGINQITPELERSFIDALNMDKQEALTFSKYVSLSAFDQSLIESRYVLDDFLFGKQHKSRTVVDVDMVFYNNDKYLRTLKEVLDFIYSFGSKDALEGGVKIVNCLNENIFIQLTEFLEKAFSDGLELEVEHFVGLSETDYLQNAYSFINIFPLMRHESYKMYYREKEIEDNLVNDSLLLSLKYEENGEPLNQYFSISFYENGMPECIAFTDAYMYSFLSKRYESLKHSYKNAIQKHDSIDFMDDILIELPRQEGNYIALAMALYENIRGEITWDPQSTFTDTNDINVKKAADLGIVNGVGDNKFDPDAKLTREQAATMLNRLADALGSPLYNDTLENDDYFSDYSSISSWAVVSVECVQVNGIMNGVGNNMFAPKDPYTREQSIITIMRLYDIVK